MFVKTGELKKAMKDALKAGGLTVGYIDGNYLVYSGSWGISVEECYASNKFKAAIMELVGELPEIDECYWYAIVKEGMEKKNVDEPVSPYYLWKRAKAVAVHTPLLLSDWYREYVFYQKDDTNFIMAPRTLTMDMLSVKELTDGEILPKIPNVSDEGVLYYKNDAMIYWVYPVRPAKKVEEILYPCFADLNFFEKDWKDKEEEETVADDGQLPY